MGRTSTARRLHIWMNGAFVGEWAISSRGEHSLTYAQEWMASPAARPLSLSLPLTLDNATIRGARVAAYFENLLPESPKILKRIQHRFGAASDDAFDLLTAIGRDCVGAVQLLPPGEEPAGPGDVPPALSPLSEAAVAQCLRNAVASNSPPGHDDDEDLRISIAGAQEKTALTFHAGRWWLPGGSTPTTHIFKLPLGLVGNVRADMRESVENEWLCAQILHAFGLDAAQCEIAQFEDQRVLVVERFDRRWIDQGGYWVRLPQEDMCQAFGLPPGLKYESHGGPGIVEIAELLRGSVEPGKDVEAFLRTQLVMWLLAATDGHAKNFSIHLLPGSRYRMTPLYDVLSVWPIAGHGPNMFEPKKLKMAMAQRGANTHYKVMDILRRHFVDTAARCGLSRDAFNNTIDEVIARAPNALDEVAGQLPDGFPAQLFDAVRNGVLAGARKLTA